MAQDNGHIDFHDLSSRIHKFSGANEEHWDELIVKYLKEEVTIPLRNSLQELTGCIHSLKTSIERLNGISSAEKELGEFMILAEVSKALRLHPRTIMKYVRNKKLHATRIGGIWRFNKNDVINFSKGE